jgi:hypothetical protein
LRSGSAKKVWLMAAAIRAFRDELVESLERATLDVPLFGLAAADSPP